MNRLTDFEDYEDLFLSYCGTQIGESFLYTFYWSDISKQWAISPDLVNDGVSTGYSSKYWADSSQSSYYSTAVSNELAKAYADLAESYMDGTAPEFGSVTIVHQPRQIALEGQATFNLPSALTNKENLFVKVNGLYQSSDNWNTSSSFLTFDEGLNEDDFVEIVWFRRNKTIGPPDEILGVSSLNDLEGALNIVEGTHLDIVPSGDSITITGIYDGGPQGPQGPDGAKGPDGDKGEDGIKGTEGGPGDPGLKGAEGDKGLTGETGGKGEDITWSVMNILPSPVNYEEGHLVLITDTTDPTEPPVEPPVPPPGPGYYYDETSIMDYNNGIVPGVTDIAPIVKNMLDAGIPVYIPAGKFVWSTCISVHGKDVSIRGEGGMTQIDITNVNWDNNSGKLLNIAGGGPVYKNPLPKRIKRGDTHVDLGFKPGPDEPVLFYNEARYSYSPFRWYYRKGEFFTPRTLHSGNTYRGQECIKASEHLASYTGVYSCSKFVRMTLKDLTFKSDTVKGSATDSTESYGIFATNIRDSVVSNVSILYGVRTCCLAISHCINFNADKIRLQLGHDGRNTRYPMSISGCQDISISNSYLSGPRSAVVVGQAPSIWANTRGLTYTNVYFHGSRWPLDTHCSAEFVNYNNCTIDGGATICGDHITFNNCTFYAHRENETIGGSLARSFFYCGEPSGANMTVNNCMFSAKGTSKTPMLFRWVTDVNTSDTVRFTPTGTLAFTNNTFEWEDCSTSIRLFQFDNSSGDTLQDFSELDLFLQGNTFSAPGKSPTTWSIDTSGVVGSSEKIRRIIAVNNIWPGGVKISGSGYFETIIKDNWG